MTRIQKKKVKVIIGILKFVRMILFIILKIIQPILDLLFKIFFGLLSTGCLLSFFMGQEKDAKQLFDIMLIVLGIYAIYYFLFYMIEIKNES